MKHNVIIKVVLLLVCCLPFDVVASLPLEVHNARVHVVDSELNVDFVVSVPPFDFGVADLLIITPKIVDGEQSLELEPIVSGRRSGLISYDREIYGRHNESNYKEPYARLKNSPRGAKEEVVYRSSIPLQSWMRGAELILISEKIVCGECIVQDQFTIVGLPDDRVVVDQPVGETLISVEKTEQRQLCFDVKFARSEFALQKNYSSNEQILATIDSVVTDNNISSIAILGYASPLGDVVSNMELSERRAQALAIYFKEQYGIIVDNNSIEWYGEDWQKLHELVKNSSLKSRSQILQIIDSNMSETDKKEAIIGLDGGMSYRYIVDMMYPQLRRAELRIIIDIIVRTRD